MKYTILAPSDCLLTILNKDLTISFICFFKENFFFFIITGIAPTAVKVDGLPSLLQ
jgi:hypothetical protein